MKDGLLLFKLFSIVSGVKILGKIELSLVNYAVLRKYTVIGKQKHLPENGLRQVLLPWVFLFLHEHKGAYEIDQRFEVAVIGIEGWFDDFAAIIKYGTIQIDPLLSIPV